MRVIGDFIRFGKTLNITIFARYLSLMRGHESPYFLRKIVISTKQIESLVTEKLADSESFLVDIKISADNQISVFIDNNKRVSIEECVALSRHIEGSLDREAEDFKLEVSSAGMDRPFKVLKQFIKNIGRKITVVTTDSTNLKGVLLAANETQIELEEVKKAKKKKEEEKIIHVIKQTDIIKAKVVISF